MDIIPPFEDLTENLMPGFIRIRFGDYFDIRQPHYKSLDQLDRAHCYYLSDAWDRLDRYVNNPALDHIPFKVLESLRVWDIGRYDSLIDINGDVIDLSYHDDIYGQRWHGVVPCDEIGVQNWLCRLSAINNVRLNDRLDIEASIIYNLYEVVPLTKRITVEFLRYYFWCDALLDAQRREFEIKEAPTQGTLCLLWAEQDTSDALEADTGLVRSMLDCDILKDEIADLESFEQHETIIADHRKMLEEESRKYGTLYLKAAFGAPYYEQLRRLELQILHKIQLESSSPVYSRTRHDYSGFSGFVAELEDFETGFHSVKANGVQKVYNLPLKVVEVILRAKLWYTLGSEIIYDGIMMKDMLDILWDYWDSLCKVNYRYQQKKQFIDSIISISRQRNEWAHGSKGYSVEEANKIMQNVYTVIKEINFVM